MKFPVVELFGPTVQGEGAVAGQTSFFVRTGGCSYRCSWCDSMHAVDPSAVRAARRLDAREVFDELVALSAPARRQYGKKFRPWVTLTGGDPVLWDLEPLVAMLYFGRFRVAVETQGALWRDWLEQCDLVTCSPKPPSSGMSGKLSVPVLQKYAVRLGDRLVLKVVAFDEVDLDFAERVRRAVPGVRLYLSAGTSQVGVAGTVGARLDACAGYAWLCDSVLKRPALHDAVVGMQMHVLAWGRELGR